MLNAFKKPYSTSPVGRVKKILTKKSGLLRLLMELLLADHEVDEKGRKRTIKLFLRRESAI